MTLRYLHGMKSTARFPSTKWLSLFLLYLSHSRLFNEPSLQGLFCKNPLSSVTHLNTPAEKQLREIQLSWRKSDTLQTLCCFLTRVTVYITLRTRNLAIVPGESSKLQLCLRDFRSTFHTVLFNELPYKVYFARIRCLRLLNIEYPE